MKELLFHSIPVTDSTEDSDVHTDSKKGTRGSPTKLALGLGALLFGLLGVVIGRSTCQADAPGIAMADGLQEAAADEADRREHAEARTLIDEMAELREELKALKGTPKVPALAALPPSIEESGPSLLAGGFCKQQPENCRPVNIDWAAYAEFLQSQLPPARAPDAPPPKGPETRTKAQQIQEFNACIDSKNDKYTKPHKKRYKDTFQFLLNEWPDLPNDIQAVEFGGKGSFGICLGAVKGAVVHEPMGDYRFPICTLKSAAFDLVMSMEVIEHIHDSGIGDDNLMGSVSTYYRGDGVTNHLFEMRRLLKPSGYALVSTPNMNGWPQLLKHMSGRPNYQHYFPHTREYSDGELRHLMTEVGLAPKTFTTINTYNLNDGPADVQALLKIHGWPTDNKKVTSFAIAQRHAPAEGSMQNRLNRLWRTGSIPQPTGSQRHPCEGAWDP